KEKERKSFNENVIEHIFFLIRRFFIISVVKINNRSRSLRDSILADSSYLFSRNKLIPNLISFEDQKQNIPLTSLPLPPPACCILTAFSPLHSLKINDLTVYLRGSRFETDNQMQSSVDRFLQRGCRV